MEAESTPSAMARVLVLYTDELGTPDWLDELAYGLQRFGLQVGTLPLSGVPSIPDLLAGQRSCVFVLVESSRRGPKLRLKWQAEFRQLASSTQLLRVVDEHGIADVIADAVLSDVERISTRRRRQRASTVTHRE